MCADVIKRHYKVELRFATKRDSLIPTILSLWDSNIIIEWLTITHGKIGDEEWLKNKISNKTGNLSGNYKDTDLGVNKTRCSFFSP